MYADLLEQLRNQLEDLKDREKVQALRLSPLLEEHELLQATYALLAKRHHLEPIDLHFSPLSSGALPLFRKGFFPWRALPYPKEHAELGTRLVQLGEEKLQTIARQMAHFQEATFDHNHKPLYSLFQQERGASPSALEEANRAFFAALDLTHSPTYHFVDHTLCMVSRRSETATLLCVGSGCKSGMGAFLSHDAGIVNFGPQLLPLDNCAGFGLAGLAQKAEVQSQEERFSLSYLCRLAAPSPRHTPFAGLCDSGYCGLWIESEIEGGLNGISIKSHFEGLSPLNKIVFSFFGKGEGCCVAGSHILKPRSLDRYLGPAQPLAFSGRVGKVHIEATEGVGGMEIIPLAADNSFWGADFLVAFTLSAPTLAFRISP
jgi:hypothetical protein